jgi:hypothetical protein
VAGRSTLLLVGLVACGQPALIGTDLGGQPTPDFSLTDQTGQTICPAELRGTAVALTSLYSTCPDSCPLMTTTLRQTHEARGADAAHGEPEARDGRPRLSTPSGRRLAGGGRPVLALANLTTIEHNGE